MPEDRQSQLIRIAIVQLPHDLVEQHIPASVQDLDLVMEATDPRARHLLMELQEKLDKLEVEVWELANAQAFSHVESVLSFCGKDRRRVDVVIFPDMLPYSWGDLIDRVRGKQGIPVVVAGSHVIQDTPVTILTEGGRPPIPVKSPSWRPEVLVNVRGYPVTIWVRRWSELFLELARPARGSVRALFAIPSAPAGDEGALQRDSRTSEIQRRIGVPIALANAGGYSRFFARFQNGHDINEKASGEFPISSLLYRVPPGDSTVTISDVDLLQQRQAIPDTSAPIFRAVTVAPLIQEDDFPEYCRYLRDMRESGDRSMQWVQSERASWVRQRTLERLARKRKLLYKTFQMKLTEAENSCGPARGLGELHPLADPSDIERLVDAVVVPSRANRIWYLLESIKLTSIGRTPASKRHSLNRKEYREN